MEEAKNLSMLLNLFVDCSSLQINCNKSPLIVFRLSQEEVQFSMALGMQIGALCHDL